MNIKQTKIKLLAMMLVVSSTMLFSCTKNNESTPSTPSIEDVSTVDVDEMYAQEVIDLIEALNENSTTQDVEYILQKYNDLTSRQKTLVTNYYKLEIFGKAILINEAIEGIDANNFTIDEFIKAKEEYDAFIAEYGDDARSKIKQSCQDKMVDLELTSLNLLLENANSIELKNNCEIAMFSLLISQIDAFYDDLKNDKQSQIISYDSYLTKKNQIIERAGILYDGDYSLSYVNDGIVYANDFDAHFDNGLGFIHSIEFSKGGNTAEVDMDCFNEDWSNYNSFGFFIRFNHAIDDRTGLIPNNNWDNVIFSNPVLVDDNIHLYFYEISLDTLNSPFSGSPDKPTFLQVYFGNTEIDSMSISNLVYFNKDYSKINEMIAKANSVNLSTNLGLTQFTLLSEKIDALVTPKDVDKVSNYSAYLSKKEQVSSICDVVHNTLFTVSYNGDYPAFSQTDSADFGYNNSLSFDNGITNKIQIFADGGKGKNWSSYYKISMFVELDTQMNANPILTINYNESLNKTGTMNNYLDSDNVYYLEFELNTDSAFTGNPFISIYINGTSYNVKVTNWVGFIDG